MKAKLLLATILICASAMMLQARLPLPIRVIGGTKFYYHEVEKKETLYSIAHKLGITEADIAKYNPGVAQDGLKAGQYLFFPVADFAGHKRPSADTSQPGAAAAPPQSFTHTVEKGETLYGISKNYGISTADIIRLNPEANAGIREGQTLQIPQAQAQQPATQGNEAPVTADTDEPQQDSTMVYVTIRPGDTMFSTAKRYNTSIDKLMELNPGISPQNFKSGDIIRIRPNYYTTIEAERETTEFHTYEIQRGDTYFSLSRRFNVSVDDLKAANPDMKKKLKRGKTLYIPVKKTETVLIDPSMTGGNRQEIIQEVYDSIHVFNDDNNINVALMLPFMLNQTRPNKQARLFTEFYKGFLMAVDTIRKQNVGKSINVYAFDTQDSKSHVSSALKSGSMDSMDIIFTPDDSDQIDLLAQFGTENKIAVVNSFSLKNDNYNDYPTLFQVNTPQNYMQAKLFDFFDETFHGYEVLFLNMPTEEEKEMIGELRAHLDAKGVPYTTLDIETSLQADTLSQSLTPGRKYVIIPTSSGRNILIKSLDAIKSVKLDRYDVNLCLLGHPEWTTYTAEFGADFNQVDTYLYSRFFTKHDSQDIHDFDEKYHQWYGEYMIYAAPKFGLLGYDTGCYFLSLFMNGKDYNNNFNYTGLQNSFDFDRVNNWSGFINKSVYFIHFTVFNTIETIIK